MSIILQEVQLWNSPVIGSYLLWRFLLGFYKKESLAPTIFHCFIACAILSDPQIVKSIHGSRKTFFSFARSFREKSLSDLLFNIHNSMNSKKEYILRAIDIGQALGLYKWEADSQTVILLKFSTNEKYPKYLDSLGNKADILGTWFSEHDINTIASKLEISF